jgi:hypothetical protein
MQTGISKVVVDGINQGKKRTTVSGQDTVALIVKGMRKS